MITDKDLKEFFDYDALTKEEINILKLFANHIASKMKEKITSEYLKEQENHKRMIEVAEKYFTMIGQGVDDFELKMELNRLTTEYGDDPAFCALLKLESVDKHKK